MAIFDRIVVSYQCIYDTLDEIIFNIHTRSGVINWVSDECSWRRHNTTAEMMHNWTCGAHGIALRECANRRLVFARIVILFLLVVMQWCHLFIHTYCVLRCFWKWLFRVWHTFRNMRASIRWFCKARRRRNVLDIHVNAKADHIIT